MRALVVPIVLSLLMAAALATSPHVEAAMKAFQAVGADPSRLDAFCKLMEVEEENTQNAPPSAKAEMNRLLAELGPDFKATWETVKNTDPASDDGEVLYAALDRLSDNCFDSYPFPVPPKASPA